MELVLLVRLDSSKGFYDMADAMKVVGEFQNKGIDAIA